MLYLAMSCLQGRTQSDAFEMLCELEPDGIQLTPGNLPSPGFQETVAASGLPTMLHHGFAWDRYRQRVYDEGGGICIDTVDRSIHPPEVLEYQRDQFGVWLEDVVERDAIVEVMYSTTLHGLRTRKPERYLLGCGAQVEAAIHARARLAVDISHLHIQQCTGSISDDVLRRLFDYDRVVEVHVSQNDGRADQHRMLSGETPHLGWALERGRAGVPVVFESYMHLQNRDDCRRAVDSLRS